MSKIISNTLMLLIILSLVACGASSSSKSNGQARPEITLQSIELTGLTLDSGFDANKTHYSATVGNDVTSFQLTPTSGDDAYVITINGQAAISGTSNDVPLDVGANVIQVSVSDGTHETIYEFTVTRPASADADLTALGLSSGSLIPQFSSTITTYSVYLDNAVNSLTITPSANAAAAISVNNATVISGQASDAITLAVGDNAIDVVVTAEDGTQKTYSITATRLSGATGVVPVYSSNADLSSLTVSSGSLSPAFSSGVTNYSMTVANGVSTLQFTPTLADTTASMTLNGSAITSGTSSSAIALNVGNNNITVAVTAEDGATVKTYSISVTREALNTNNDLSALTISSGTLSPAFDTATANYSVDVTNATTSISLTATLADSTASMTVGGVATNSGQAANIALVEGANNIAVVVTAEDSTTKTYTVVVNRQLAGASTIKDLSGLIITANSVDQTLDQTALTQSVNYDYATTSITVTPTVLDSTATVTVNGIGVTSGSASGAIALTVGNNNIDVVVTAEDLSTKTFTITAIRAANSNLANIDLSVGFLDQTFQNTLLSYTASVGYVADNVRITATLEDAAASMTIGGVAATDGVLSEPVALSVGSNSIDIVVAATDATTTTYTVDITRQTLASVAQQLYLKASNTMADRDVLDTVDGPTFGMNMAISGNTLVVSSPFEGSAAMGINGDGVYNCNGSLPIVNCAQDSGAVYVFVRDASGWTQQAYIKASNAAAGDEFGKSVAIEGDTLVVGSRFEDTTMNNSGAAYVFRRSGTTWTEETILKASNAGVNDEFGSAVAISGDTIVVGAFDEDAPAESVADVNGGDDYGAAYVFVYDGANWNEQDYLKASNPDTNDYFGSAVAIDGDLIAVSATGEASSAQNINGDDTLNDAFSAGAVYIFARSGGVWTQEAYVKASNAKNLNIFGGSVALDSSTLVVGAQRQSGLGVGVGATEEVSGNSNSGAAYVFVRDAGGTWTQQVYIKASNPSAGDYFGHSVALSGDTLVVGAPYEQGSATGVNGVDDNLLTNAGAAYVYKRVGTSWTETHYIKASNTEANDQFGVAVTADGDTVVVSAPYEDGAGTGTTGNELDNTKQDSGAVYIFQ